MLNFLIIKNKLIIVVIRISCYALVEIYLCHNQVTETPKKVHILERNECDQFATLKQTNHNLIPLPYNDRKPSITRLLSGTHTASNIHQATSFVVRRVHN